MTTLTGPKSNTIKELFGGIASTYDTANDVITFGMARSWRKRLVKMSGVKPGMKVLDCATGTGDLAINFKEVVGKRGRVIGTDFCKEMIELAPQKAAKKNLDISFKLGDVTQLDFRDDKFDISSIAYGIRNVDDPQQGIREMARVTKPGGKVMILETGKITAPILKHLIPFYFNKVVPLLGGLVSGNRAAYQYLNKSSSQFPCRDQFTDIMRSTNSFKSVTYKSIMGGASYIYIGTVK